MAVEANRLREYKFVAVGEIAVGKSALGTRFLRDQFMEEYDPTIEDSFQKQFVVDDELVTIEMLDTACQEGYYYLNEYYVRQHDGFFLIYSVAYRPSFERIEVFHSTIMRIKKYDSTSFAVVLIGNQSDREGDRRVGKNEGVELAKQLNCQFIETSAKIGTNVEEAFMMIVREMKRLNSRREEEETTGPASSGRNGIRVNADDHATCCSRCVIL